MIKIGTILKERLAHKEDTHKRARKLKGRGACEKCGIVPARPQVHHIDMNPFNNTPSNLMRLCGLCHASEHKRPRRKCIICGGEATGHGYCPTHYQRFKRHGDPHKILAHPAHHKGKSIMCIDTGEVFQSIGEAAEKKKIDRSCISRAIKKGTKSCGISFRELPETLPPWPQIPACVRSEFQKDKI